MERSIVLSLLGKLAVENPTQYNAQRAEAKLVHRLKTRGVPTDLTVDEKSLVESLGFATADGPVIPGEVEIPAEVMGKPVTPKPKQNPLGARKVGKLVVIKSGKAVAKPKAKVATKSAAKPVIKSAKKREPGEIAESGFRVGSSLDAFVTLMKPGKPVKKLDAVKHIAKQSQCSPISAANVLCWARRVVGKNKNPNQSGNPFDFQIVEFKDAKGQRVVAKMPKDWA